MLKYSILVLEQDGGIFTQKTEENNGQKSGKNRCPYPAFFSVFLNIDCASFLKYLLFTYYLYYKYKIFLWKKFSQEHIFVTLANSQKCLFWKTKSMQKHCQKKVN